MNELFRSQNKPKLLKLESFKGELNLYFYNDADQVRQTSTAYNRTANVTFLLGQLNKTFIQNVPKNTTLNPDDPDSVMLAWSDNAYVGDFDFYDTEHIQLVLETENPIYGNFNATQINITGAYEGTLYIESNEVVDDDVVEIAENVPSPALEIFPVSEAKTYTGQVKLNKSSFIPGELNEVYIYA